MPTITVNVAAGNDDGNVWDTSLEQSGNSCEVGWDDRGGGNKQAHNYFRFTGVNVPQSRTIISAKITVYNMSYGPFGGVTVYIYCCAEDNSGQITSYSDYFRSLTSNYASWTPSSTGQVDTPSLVNPVQEVVNRSGWAYGNAMQFQMRNQTPGTQEYKMFPGSYNGGYAALLTIEYQSKPGGVMMFCKRWVEKYSRLMRQGAVDLSHRPVGAQI